MAEVGWSREALASLELIRSYINQFDPEAASRFAIRLIEVGESLQEYPERGRAAARGMRELTIVPPYVIRYRFEDDRVEILSIRHGRQQR